MNEEKHCEIGTLISQCLEFFKQNNYSRNRILCYKSHWKRGIMQYLDEKGLTDYTTSIGASYSTSCSHEGMVRQQERELIRSIQVLDDMLTTGEVRMCWRQEVNYPLSGAIGEKAEHFINYLESLRRSKVTIKSHRLYLNGFINWLTGHGINEVGHITEYHIMKFVGTYMGPSKANVISSMRMLFNFWHDNGIYPTDLDKVWGPYSVAKREKIPSVYKREEVLQIEFSVSRSSAVGKRNYAMLLLASRLGLRASDIAFLKLENIDWPRNIVSLTMHKTGKPIELPLLADVGNAIIDYVRYGRMDTPSRSVFISTRAPYHPATKAMVCSAIRQVIGKSGVDTRNKHHGPHCLRHSLASALLEDNIPMPVISESLGHTYTSSTMKYLRIDMRSLMKCALPVPPVPDEFYNQKGGIYYV